MILISRKVLIDEVTISHDTINVLSGKLGRLLLKLPNLIDLTIATNFRNCTQFFDILKGPISGNPMLASTAVSLPSVQVLKIYIDSWNFFVQICPNLRELTVLFKTAESHDFSPPSLDIETLGKTHLHLKKLHFPEMCEEKIVEGGWEWMSWTLRFN